MQVNKLDLQDNELASIPDCLLCLPNLNKLNLFNNQLTNLPELSEWSPSLTELNLSQNKLSNIPGNPKAPKLRNLYLSGNDLTAVPQCISNFTNLEKLDLSENKGIQVLPDEMGCLERLQFINLTGLKLKNLPEPCVKSAKDCVAYLKSRLHNARPFFSMKLLLFGKQNSGKTTLVARLQGRDYANASTVGVDISEWECDDGRNTWTFNFSVWDFAGQEEHYTAHQCFLSDCSIYLLLFNLKDGKTAFTKIEPLLSNIAVRTKDACVHIVGTHLDEIPQDQRSSVDNLLANIRSQAERYVAIVQVQAVSLKHPLENIDKLKKSIYKSASEYKTNGEKVMGRVVPDSYHKLYQYFKKEVAADVKRNIRGPIMVRGGYITLIEKICGSTLDPKELKRITQFLIDAGVLLHYDDHSHNLDELYFIDPRWLCDMMSSIVSVGEKNPYVKDGILLLSNIGLVLHDEKFLSQHLGQYLALLDRFEIAFALDNQKVLIPSLLPETPPTNIYKLLTEQPAYTRFIVLDVQTTPPGFWSRLLSRMMHSIPQLQSAINMDHNSSNVSKSVTLSRADRFLNSVSLSHTFKDASQVRLTYWKSGIYCKDSDFFIGVSSLKILPNFNMEGILITASYNMTGMRLFCQLIDLTTTLCDTVFSEGGAAKHITPCPRCMQVGTSEPDLMDVNACWELLDENKNITRCKGNHTVQLPDIIPDLLLGDVDLRFTVRSAEHLYCDTELLGKGGEATVYSGTYRGRPVAIKKYTNSSTHNDDHFRQLRKEIMLFQKLNHPCLINLIAVCVQPTMDVILERAPLGSLYDQIITRQQPIHRIVVHRITTQVAAALRALHNMGIIYRDLKASNVLIWSLDPESLCHCKLTDFGTAIEQAPIGVRERAQGTKGFTAPEVLGRNGHNYIYNHMCDVFSFGMLLYQMIARREPFQEMKEVGRNDAVIRGERPKFQEVPQAETAYFYLTKLMQCCWNEEPFQRPTTTEIVIKTSLSPMQSIMCVLPIRNGLGLRPSCSVPQTTLTRAGMTCESSELWICSSDNKEGTEIDIYPFSTMKSRVHFAIQSIVQCISVCGDLVWVSSRTGLEHSQVLIFDICTGACVHEIPMNADTVSCIASSGHSVYCGTEDGFCIMFPIDARTITPSFQPVMNKISDIFIDSIVIMPDYLWVSTAHQIHLLDCSNLAIKGTITATPQKKHQRTFTQTIHPKFKRTSSNSVLDRRLKKEYIGKMKLSHDKSIIWSSHLHTSACVHAWNVDQREIVFTLHIDEHIKRIAYCSNQGTIVTAMVPALDTLWVGTMDGHILVFGNENLLTWFHPYMEHVRFLECNQCDQDGHVTVTSGGKSFKSPIVDIEAYKDINEKGESVDTAGTIIVWEAFPSKMFSQVQLVQDNSYTYMDDHDAMRNVIAMGNFIDSTHLTD